MPTIPVSVFSLFAPISSSQYIVIFLIFLFCFTLHAENSGMSARARTDNTNKIAALLGFMLSIDLHINAIIIISTMWVEACTEQNRIRFYSMCGWCVKCLLLWLVFVSVSVWTQLLLLFVFFFNLCSCSCFISFSPWDFRPYFCLNLFYFWFRLHDEMSLLFLESLALSLSHISCISVVVIVALTFDFSKTDFWYLRFILFSVFFIPLVQHSIFLYKFMCTINVIFRRRESDRETEKQR